MNWKKSLQKHLAFQTIQNVSINKMGHASLKKNPYETTVLTDKLEDIKFHKRKWRNDFSWKLIDERQKFKRTRYMESLPSACVLFYCRSKEGKMIRIPDTAQRLSRFSRTSEADAIIEKEVTRTPVKKKRAYSIDVEQNENSFNRHRSVWNVCKSQNATF